MFQLKLSETEVHDVMQVIDEITNEFDSVEDPELQRRLAVYAQEMPRSVRSAFNDFKLLEDYDGVFVVSGFPVDDQAIGPTPVHWRFRPEQSPTFKNEVFFLLCAALLGEAIAWSTQQDGYLVHEVAPIQAHETDQLGFSSQQYLEWHTEDAFHPFRADYLGLMCLRNPTQTPTTLASNAKLDLAHPRYDVLFEPHFTIRPDESHLEKNRALDQISLDNNREDVQQVDYEVINKMNNTPDKIAVLFGHRQSPYMRLDPYFMEPSDHPEARKMLGALCEEINENLEELVLEPGDYLFVDNFRVVHGRTPFKANYDGKDRWLKRINIVRDMRKSREARPTPASRMIS